MFSLLLRVQRLTAGFCSPITLEDPVSGYNSAISQDCQTIGSCCLSAETTVPEEVSPTLRVLVNCKYITLYTKYTIYLLIYLLIHDPTR